MDERMEIMVGTLLRYKHNDEMEALHAALHYIEDVLAKSVITEQERENVVEILRALSQDTGDVRFAELAGEIGAMEAKHLLGRHDQTLHGVRDDAYERMVGEVPPYRSNELVSSHPNASSDSLADAGRGTNWQHDDRPTPVSIDTEKISRAIEKYVRLSDSQIAKLSGVVRNIEDYFTAFVDLRGSAANRRSYANVSRAMSRIGALF
jgi:hypothetical protein